MKIISDKKSSQSILIVGNKRGHLRSHDSILLSISQITQIGQSQSFFLPDSYTGASQQIQRVSAILENRLLKLIPIDLNILELVQEVSAPNPSITSLISRHSIIKRSRQESLISTYESYAESLIKATEDAPLGAGIAQQLIQDAPLQIHGPVKAFIKEQDQFMEREDAQGDLSLMSDDSDTPYMRQVKRLLKSDWEQDKRGGKLVAIRGLQDTEEIVISMLSVLYQRKLSEEITCKQQQRLPKVVIIASQNNWLEQIQDTIENQFIKEAAEPSFKLYKSLVSKAQKQKRQKKVQEQDESFRKIFDINQVFVVLDRKFFNYLIHGELDISQVDYLIFDEVHSIYPESSYVDIMNKFIFNHKLMLTPTAKLEDKKRLPKVLAFFSLDSVLQAAGKNDSQIMKKFYFMANTFNASLLCLQKQNLVELDRDTVRKFSFSRVRNIKEVSYLLHQVKNSQEFSQQVRKYLSFRKDGKTRVTCLTESIIEKKQLQSYQFLETKYAKITLDEANQILQEFGDKLLEHLKQRQKDQQNNSYRPILEFEYQKFDKAKYFSIRMQFDEPLIQLLGKDIAKEFSTKIAIPSQKDQSQNELFWLYSHRIYLKKAHSESQAALDMCKILYSKGFLDENLRSCLIKESELLFHHETHLYQSIDQGRSSSAQYEEEKMSIIHSSELISYSYSTLDIAYSASKTNSCYTRPFFQTDQNQSILPRVVCKSNSVSYQVQEEVNDYLHLKNCINKEKLVEGLCKGQHHMPIMQYNTQQLKLFIQTILNPILKALNKYNELCDTPDLIKFDDSNVNMISESSIKELLFNKRFSEKQGNSQVNQTFIQFKNYRQRMFNIYDKNNVQKNTQEYPYLVQMINPSLERYKFPHFMTEHIENYHSQERGKPSQSSSKVQENFNRKTFLTMLMIALSDKQPTTIEFEKVKNEMGRLAQVGESIIILCQVMNMIFSGKKSFSEQDLDAFKNQTVKSEILQQKAKKVGLGYLIIMAKYYQKAPSNPQVEYQQIPRDLGEVMKSLAGLFSIYLGFGATYLLLSDFGIVEPPTSDLIIEIGKISVHQKVQILKSISQNRRDLLVYKYDQKMHLYKTLCNQQYPGINIENTAGFEFLEVLNKLVKSRGLFMKQDLPNIFSRLENTDFNDDDSLNQLRDYSIALSLSNKSSSSDSLQSVTSSASSQKNKFFENYENLDLQNEEEKSQLALDDYCQGYQTFDEMLTEDKGSTVESFIREILQKYSNDFRSAGDDEESKTSGEVSDEGIASEIPELNQRRFDDFERLYKEIMQQGYEFKNQEILMQSIVHKSFSNRLLSSGSAFDDYSQLDQDVVMQYNLQILQYLGDSILNFTISKLFYCETADNQKQWHGDFFVPTKLNELKTWFSSNNWLSFALYENYYCTITEEILRDPEFENTKFAKEAQLSINQLKNKQMTEKKAKEIAPRVPLIYDKNDNSEDQINDFNGICFRQCLAADKNKVEKLQNYPRESLNVTSKSLSLKLFKQKDVQQEDQNEVDFSEIDEQFVEYFSDVMKALIGGIFLDSGDLDKTQMILLKLINCPSVSSFPVVQHDKRVVFSIFNSKPYCKGIKIYHTQEVKDDGNIFILGFMDKQQFRCLQYQKERKKKEQLFYYDMRLYLEDAYKEFESQFVQKRKQDDKREPTKDEWLQFNKNYTKNWKVKVYSADQKRYSAIKEAAKNLYKFVSSAEENFMTRETQNIPEMREQIIHFLNQGLRTIGANMKLSLLVLESERVQSSRIRELLQSCDIKFIACLSYDMKDVGNFIHKLNNRQVHQFYERLIDFGKA